MLDAGCGSRHSCSGTWNQNNAPKFMSLGTPLILHTSCPWELLERRPGSDPAGQGKRHSFCLTFPGEGWGATLEGPEEALPRGWGGGCPAQPLGQGEDSSTQGPRGADLVSNARTEAQASVQI